MKSVKNRTLRLRLSNNSIIVYTDEWIVAYNEKDFEIIKKEKKMIEYIVVNVKTGKVLLKTGKKWEAINFMTELYEYSGDYENIFLKEINTSKKKSKLY